MKRAINDKKTLSYDYRVSKCKSMSSKKVNKNARKLIRATKKNVNERQGTKLMVFSIENKKYFKGTNGIVLTEKNEVCEVQTKYFKCFIE